MIIIAHSDDFRWFGPEENLDEWDNIIKIFNKHGYQVTDATDKEFVGIRISRDKSFNYYMDQHRMIDTIIEEAGISECKNNYIKVKLEIIWRVVKNFLTIKALNFDIKFSIIVSYFM